jgi:hypothetical protein
MCVQDDYQSIILSFLAGHGSHRYHHHNIRFQNSVLGVRDFRQQLPPFEEHFEY